MSYTPKRHGPRYEYAGHHAFSGHTVRILQLAKRYAEADVLGDMRGWLMDCEWRDIDCEDIAELDAAHIVGAVARHYEGGVAQFMRDAGY